MVNKIIKKIIPVNIWDDYYEDGYIPEGKIQETYIYVEDRKMDENDRKKYLEYLLNYININIKYLDGVKMWMSYYDSKIKHPNIPEEYHFTRPEIGVEHMTHKQRERWMIWLKLI